MPPKPPRRSPLYSAVVLAGVSLTSTALTVACGDDDNAPKPSGADASTSSSGGSSSGSSGANDSGGDTSSSDSGTPTDACPPDSEISTPPCVLIK